MPLHAANLGKVYEYLAYGYRTNDGETFFEGVSELPPAHNLFIENGKVRMVRYWHLPPQDETPVTESGLRERLVSLVEDAVRLRFQSETVWHQADRYGIPRLAFINKLDRLGADHERVLAEIEKRLGAQAAFLNLPHGLEDRLDGVIDLISCRWLVFDLLSRGRLLEAREIPEDSVAVAQTARDRLIQKTAEAVDWLADLYLAEQPITEVQLKQAIREATLTGSLVPVVCGAALRDLGIRPILDAVCDYLPSPAELPPP